jgi:hypothetical protein
MDHKLSVFSIFVLTLTSLTLAACGNRAGTPATPENRFLLPMTTETSSPGACEGCSQATLAALQTQERTSADAQAAATAEVMRANAQATLNAVNSTQSAAMTQEQNNANIIAAQVAATADIIRANAQATLSAASSTQSAAQTQDAIRQTQVQYSLQVTADWATQNAKATITQQNKNFLIASTQTAVANNIATQTQSAVATAQRYADQARQRRDQTLSQIAFMAILCLPVLVGLFLLFFWRWMKIQETQQQIDNQSATPSAGTGTTSPINKEHENHPQSEVVYNQYQPAHPTDHVRRWLEEVKRKLIVSKKDDDDNPVS